MKKVNEEFIGSLIEKYDAGEKFKPEEMDTFYCEHEDGTYTACYNTGGDAYCEDFKSITGVILYLESSLAVEECMELEKKINGYLKNIIINQLMS